MAAPVGELFVKLAADVAGFKADLDRATRMAEGFSKTLRSAVGGAIAAIAGGLTVGAFAKMTKNAIDAADEIGKMSQKIGVSVEELSALQVAAQLANVSSEQLHIGLRQLAINALAAADGSGEAADVFRALGISVTDTAGRLKSTEQLWSETAARLAGIEDGAAKTAITMRIFGKSGDALIPLINELEKTRKEAALLNAIIGKDTAQAAERFNDNLTRIRIAVQGIFMRIAEALLPTLEKLSTQWVQNAKDAKELGAAGRIADTGLKILATAGALTVNIFSQAGRALGGFAAMMAAFVERDWKEAGKQAARIALEVGNDFVESGRQTAAQLHELWEDAGKRAEKNAPRHGRQLAAPAIVAAAEIEKARKAQADAINRMHDDIMAGIEADEEIRKQQGLVNASFVESAQLSQEAAESMVYTWDQAGNRIEMTREAFDELGRQQKKNEEMAKDLGFTFSSAFEDAVLEGEKLSDVLKALEKDIARIILRKTVTEPMANAIAGAIGNAFNFAGGRAEGGEVPANSWALVGERGPELAYFGAGGGDVIANRELFARNTPRVVQGMRTQVANRRYVANVTLNVGSLDPRGAAAVIAANSEVIRGVIRGAFNRQGRRSPI